ncbi:MAG TPA: ZIP family metal transporter [Candidatus Bathyarchaeia archaeon]|nr:ZIP family metal transporter [Candidatus Bathyarchaeia archaeon]
MEAIFLSIATFASTYFGGLLAVKMKNKLNLIMGFTAGVILGVVFFEIFPEIIEQIEDLDFAPTGVMVALIAGFLIFHILEKAILIHHGHEGDYAEHVHPQVGVLSALALVGHSFLDGFGIGLGFQASPAVGVLVAIAVISHDFTDGMNTVTLMLAHQNSERKAKQFLLLDAVVPVLGVLATLFFHIPAYFVVLYLGFFAGFLLYIGASDILPQAHMKKSSYQLMSLTVLGVLLVFVVSRFA